MFFRKFTFDTFLNEFTYNVLTWCLIWRSRVDIATASSFLWTRLGNIISNGLGILSHRNLLYGCSSNLAMSDSVKKDQKKHGLKHILLNILAWLASQRPTQWGWHLYVCPDKAMPAQRNMGFSLKSLTIYSSHADSLF